MGDRGQYPPQQWRMPGGAPVPSSPGAAPGLELRRVQIYCSAFCSLRRSAPSFVWTWAYRTSLGYSQTPARELNRPAAIEVCLLVALQWTAQPPLCPRCSSAILPTAHDADGFLRSSLTETARPHLLLTPAPVLCVTLGGGTQVPATPRSTVRGSFLRLFSSSTGAPNAEGTGTSGPRRATHQSGFGAAGALFPLLLTPRVRPRSRGEWPARTCGWWLAADGVRLWLLGLGSAGLVWQRLVQFVSPI